jgi:adenylosuccinate lyase
VIPLKDVKLIKAKAKFNIHEIDDLEKSLHHDVIAFTRSVSNSLGKERQ